MRRPAPAVLLLALGLLCAAPLAAQESPDSVAASKRRELEEISRRARENREAAGRLKGQETKAVSRLRSAERDLNLTRKRLRNLQSRQNQLDRQLNSAQNSLERNTAMLEQQRATLARRLRGLYKYGAVRELEFLLSTTSFAQLLARWDYLVMIGEQDRLLLEQVRARKEDVEADRRRLALNLSEIGRNARRTSVQNTRLAALRRERASSVETIRSQREAYEAAAAELEKTARSIQKLLAELERRRREEASRARAQGRNPQPYTGDFAKGHGALDWPVRGSLVGRFGPERNPRWGTTTLNNGVDIGAPMGTPVKAVAKGRVDYTSEDYGAYGQIVILNHGDGYYTLYGHLSQILVSVGMEVMSGGSIGSVGDTGSLKGTILHFEVRKGGTALDPEDWLR